MLSYCEEIIAHYCAQWANEPTKRKWELGPITDLPKSFCILEFAPSRSRRMWTYATCGMSIPSDYELLELHLFSPIQNETLVELLTSVAHFHRTGAPLGLGHTVNFGRPWLPGSTCNYGLISLPYLDGPTLEKNRCQQNNKIVENLWLVPITAAERKYKTVYGLEALEKKLEEANVDYLNPSRPDVV